MCNHNFIVAQPGLGTKCTGAKKSASLSQIPFIMKVCEMTFAKLNDEEMGLSSRQIEYRDFSLQCGGIIRKEESKAVHHHQGRPIGCQTQKPSTKKCIKQSHLVLCGMVVLNIRGLCGGSVLWLECNVIKISNPHFELRC